tara:strand:- start:589 stop:777 length:189 start_codon:yes stop_codon:yes gene_type:complete
LSRKAGDKMKKIELTKKLFINWSTEDLKNHLTFLESRLCPTANDIKASLLVQEVLDDRGEQI